MNTSRESSTFSSAALLATFLLVLSAAFTSCQREACPGAITQSGFEQTEADDSAVAISADQGFEAAE